MNLNSPVKDLALVGPVYQKRLEKIGITTLHDLLYHIPSKYNDFSRIENINRTRVGDTVTIKGKLNSLINQFTKTGKRIQIGEVEDKTGSIMVIWFNQTFLTRTLYPGSDLSLSGKIDWFGTKKALISPEYEIIRNGEETTHTGKIIPVYPETYGVSSKWLRTKIKNAYKVCGKELKEYLPETYGFVTLPTAIKSVHFPQNLKETETGRKRLAFDELLALQIQSLERKRQWRKNKANCEISISQKDIKKFTDRLPFTLTKSQQDSVKEILTDMEKGYPMNRLLEGDVGSGKTVVATVAAFAAFGSGFQSVIMAPTQILAQQHYETLNKLLQPFKVRICFVTASSKSDGLERCDIFVGTHALIHQKIDFEKVGLVVIDEQHRFGVEQREHLIKKVGTKIISPHILTMTATPIPRTVALTFYGDLDLSTLTEIPLNRQKITTWVVPPQKRDGAYSWIKSQIKDHNSQAFVVCPLIEESEKETMKDVRAVKAEYENLKKVFKNLKIGLLHGKQKMVEKNKILDEFRKKKIDILVATPVVEVGIDIPNATIMVVEAAERFGLAQLHQLRGRVGRGDKKSYCLLFSEAKTEKILTRLNAMTENVSGFELAELDLKLRGPGEIFGLRQHGIPDLKIASWTDIDLIKKAKIVAEQLSSHN